MFFCWRSNIILQLFYSHLDTLFNVFQFQILDEVYKILHYIKVTVKLARPYKVTDELFDLSTMAMEYFREKLEPTLPEIRLFANGYHEFPSPLGMNITLYTFSVLKYYILIVY